MKTKSYSNVILALRVLLGWIFLYAGLTKVFDPNWSAAFYLKNAQTFPGLFNMFMQPEVLPIVNFLNAWGLMLIGIALIAGLWVRYASLAGILMMVMYYLPILNFPIVGEHSFLVDEHIIYACTLLLLYFADAGKLKGLDGLISKKQNKNIVFNEKKI